MNRLTKAQIRHIRALTRREARETAGAFVVEGDKLCREWLNSTTARVLQIVSTPTWAEQAQDLLVGQPSHVVFRAEPQEFERLSVLQSPPPVLLVAHLPHKTGLPLAGWTIALDDVQDPGNVGTILRIADWFGIPHVICSPASADAFSSKVVQAGMGAHLRVAVHRAALLPWLEQVTVPVLAADLGGPSVYTHRPAPEAVLLIGNESRGLAEPLLARADSVVSIPRLGGAESLNAAVSAGILCALLRGES